MSAVGVSKGETDSSKFSSSNIFFLSSSTMSEVVSSSSFRTSFFVFLFDLCSGAKIVSKFREQHSVVAEVVFSSSQKGHHITLALPLLVSTLVL